jgi:hypothetical protein
MSSIADPERLRSESLAFYRAARKLPSHNPERSKLQGIACKMDEAADQIEALSPMMRADLEDMLAMVRRH